MMCLESGGDMEKIKVLHIIKSMDIGGIESYIINMHRHINRDKYEFDYLMWNEDNSYYEDEIKSLGGQIFKIKFSKNPLMNIIRFYTFFKNSDYDVIHSHSLFYSGIFAYAGYMAKTKIFISHMHSKSDNRVDNVVRKTYKKLAKYLMKKYSTYCCACSYEAAIYGYDKINKKVIILNDYIDVDKYTNVFKESCDKIASEYDLYKQDIVIGNVGRLSIEKNQKFIIELVNKIVTEQSINIKCLFIGDGPEKDDLMERITSLGLNDYFSFVGSVSNVNEYLKCMDIFIFPSLYEGFGMALLEAQATGLYCLASNQVPKNTDMELGLVKYLPLNDIETWIKEITKFHKKDLPSKTIKNQICKKGFDISTSLSIMESIYKGEYCIDEIKNI